MMQFVGLVGTRLGQRQVNLGISSFLTTHNPGWCYFRPTSGGGLTCLLAVLKRISGWRILRPFHGWCWHILWCIFGSIPTGPRRTLSSGASTQVYARDSSTQFFNFSIFQFFNFSIFQFSNFSIFQFSHFPIFTFSFFPIFRYLRDYCSIERLLLPSVARTSRLALQCDSGCLLRNLIWLSGSSRNHIVKPCDWEGCVWLQVSASKPLLIRYATTSILEPTPNTIPQSHYPK